MSIIEQTTKLLLTQFKGSSINPAILEYYTSDMKKLDDAFTSVDGRMSTLETASQDYAERIDSLEAWKNDTVDFALTDLNNRVSSIESIIETVSTANIDDLRRRLDAVEIKVDTNATAIESLNGDINVIEANIATINSNLGSLDTRISTNESNIATLQECCLTVNTSLTNLQQQIYNNDNDIESLQNRMTIAENNIQGNATDITTLATQTRTNTTDIAELKEMIHELDPSVVSGLYDRVDTLETETSDIGDKLNELEAINTKQTESVTLNGLTLDFVKLNNWIKLHIYGTLTLAFDDGDSVSNVIPIDYASSEIGYSKSIQPISVNDMLINLIINGRNITFKNVNGNIPIGTTINQEVFYC